MVVFNTLEVMNFKRFAGAHVLPLSGQGQMTVFAAQNGIGKTTLLDSIHLALYGKRGFVGRYPGVKFEEWLHNAFSIEAPEHEFREMSFAIEMESPIHGTIRISRQYWLLDKKDGGLSEEFGITFNGKPLELEAGEKRTDVAERWLEAFLPISAMRRFLVDGERLSELDTRHVDSALVEGIDDLLGLGTLDRLNRHLNSLQTQTLRKMAPSGEKAKLQEMMDLSVSYQREILEDETEIEETEAAMFLTENRMDELNEAIQLSSREAGDADNTLRIQYAKRHSELTSIRRELLEHSMNALPFILSGLPSDLSDWDAGEVRTTLEDQKRTDENLSFIEQTLDGLRPPPGANIRNRIIAKANEITAGRTTLDHDSPLGMFTLSQLDQFEHRTIELNLTEKREGLELTMEAALDRLNQFEWVEAELRAASEGRKITDLANELKEKSTELGGLQARHTQLTETQNAKRNGLNEIDDQVTAIRSKSDKDSYLNRKITTIQQIRAVLLLSAQRERELMAEPLQAAFSEGFSLLSRKADRIEGVSIDPTTYKTVIQMRGFEGNWLDRDLSATEKQHVGLSLLFALRKAGQRAIPVIIDTPTSRMDRDHKAWSVTRFYPELSHQVIVLATSDDLGDGLYHELVETGALGCELHIQEATENSVTVDEANLAAFFGG
jgi:DNA sulfur modification protein DndD